MAKNNAVLWVLGIIALFIILNYFDIVDLGSIVIPDHMKVYDDFETGLREDLWDFSNENYVSLSNGKLNLGEYHPSTSNEHYRGTAISKKLFSTEDIKVRLSAHKFESPCGTSGCSPPHSPLVYFGDVSIPIMYNSNSYPCGNRHCDEMCQDNDVILEIKRYDDTDLSKYVVLINGHEVLDSSNSEPVPLKFFGGSLEIEEVRFLPYFSCEINYENEVVVRDKFTEGSEVSLNTLTYTPLKFCPQDLGVLIFSEQGLTDEKGSITKNIAEGETLTVPSGQYWQVDYVTKYVDDMAERCGLGDAYDTNLRKCVSVVYQQDFIRQCNTMDDCPIVCEGIDISCVNNMCVYSGKCLNPPALSQENLWDKIQNVWQSFWSFIKSLLGG